MNDILKTALTYLGNNDRLIYSYRGNTFLQGGELYDNEHDGRGRIDCSTLVHLALQGITYERSPYATGKTGGFFSGACRWQPGDLVFFRAPEGVLEEYYKYGAYLGISHVGIVAEDPDMMINATGSSDHERNAAGHPVKLTRIEKKGMLLMKARITP